VLADPAAPTAASEDARALRQRVKWMDPSGHFPSTRRQERHEALELILVEMEDCCAAARRLLTHTTGQDLYGR